MYGYSFTHFTQDNVNFFANILMNSSDPEGKNVFLPYIVTEDWKGLFNYLFEEIAWGNLNDVVGIITGAPVRDANKFKNMCFSQSFLYQFFQELAEFNILECSDEIWDAEFFNSDIESIKIPQNIRKIGAEAFSLCRRLRSIEIPEEITTLEFNVLARCSNLERIYLPKNLRSIQTGAMAYCRSLKDIYYKGTMAEWKVISKSLSWNMHTGDYVVHCSDGDLKDDFGKEK